MSNFKTIQIGSSHGTVYADAGNGKVIEACTETPQDKDNVLPRIIKFDVKEFKQYWGELEEYIDILNIGYWFKDGKKTKYEAPENSWREEVKISRAENS